MLYMQKLLLIIFCLANLVFSHKGYTNPPFTALSASERGLPVFDTTRQKKVLLKSYKVSGVVFVEESKRRKKQEILSDIIMVAYQLRRIEGSDIALLELDGGQYVKSVDVFGNFEFVLSGDFEYSIQCVSDEFTAEPIHFPKRNIASGEHIAIEVSLKKETRPIVKIRYVDDASNKPLQDVTVMLTDIRNSTAIRMVTGRDGTLVTNIDPARVYQLQGNRKGYFFQPADTIQASMLHSGINWLDIRLKPIEVGQSFRLDGFFYGINDYELTPAGKKALDEIVSLIEDNPTIQFELACHTDSRGDESYNLELTQRRAEVSVAYMVEKGVPPYRVLAKGYGETQLLNHCKNGVKCTTQEHAENRRLELKVVKIIE